VQLDNETLVRPSADISQGQMIKIIGTKNGAHNFRANEIRPWVGQGTMGSGQYRDRMNSNGK